MQAGLERDLTVPERVAWFLAEQGGRCVGVVKSGRYPAPPVYAEMLAGLTGDDFHVTTAQTLSPLLNAAEAFQREGKVAVINASCSVQDTVKHDLLNTRGYRPLTNWMVRSVETQAQRPVSVRPANADDLPALMRLNAHAQEQKRQANPRFWTPHPQAAERFAGWMRHVLTLTDRDLLVCGQEGQVRGFVVVQPTGLPPAHDASRIATLDDLAADDWDTFRVLLDAAHHAATARGFMTLQVITPANWRERNTVLQDAGFRTANVWLMREAEFLTGQAF